MIKFGRGSKRKTEAFMVSIGYHIFFISYKTVVGYQGPLGNCRRENHWGPTTGKHMKEMEINNYPIVSDEELEKREVDAIIDIAQENLGIGRFRV